MLKNIELATSGIRVIADPYAFFLRINVRSSGGTSKPYNFSFMEPSSLLPGPGPCLDVQQLGFVISAIGLDRFLGQLIIPAVPERIGRKPVVLFSFVATGGALWLLMGLAPNL